MRPTPELADPVWRDFVAKCWHSDRRLRPLFRELQIPSWESAASMTFLSTMGSHPLMGGLAAPPPPSLRTLLVQPLQPGVRAAVAVLYVSVRHGVPLVCCVRETDGQNAGIFTLPSVGGWCFKVSFLTVLTSEGALRLFKRQDDSGRLTACVLQ